MSAIIDNVQLLGLLVQAVGAALIGLLCLMLNQAVCVPALSAWWRGWVSLACALVALMFEQAMPASAGATLPLYLFGEYLFGWWIIEGCARFAGREWPHVPPGRLIIALAIVALALPRLTGYEFRAFFVVQSLVLTLVFAAALVALLPAVRRLPKSPGLLAMRIALALLLATFLAYVPVFAANLLFDAPLPLLALKLSSAAHLMCEFLLGFGGVVLVLEQSREKLAALYDDLAESHANYRKAAERDALTMAYNRHAFFQLLNFMTDADEPVSGAIAMIDADDLKLLNDRHGHVEGDVALVRIVEAVQQKVRPEDHLFRWGGDEFVLVAPGLSAAALTERLDLVNASLALTGTVEVQVSHGVVEFRNATDLLDAVERADACMFEQKRERAAQRRRRGLEVLRGGGQDSSG
ncbi:MAG TPA: GGDEF domain-containing protein [Rudaea sp.]